MHSTISINRRRAIAGIALGAGLPALAQQGGAAFRPNRPVKLISPQPAGGSTDAVLRPIALKLGELWGQSVVVDNKPGGGTIIGTLAVAQAPADGHTLGLAINSLTINPSLRHDLPYDTLKDLTPITQIGTTTVGLVAHQSLGVNNLPEFIALAKSKPGSLSWASLGIGTGGHITGELLARRAGIDIVHVPFAGSAHAYRELLPGRVQAGFVVLDSAVPHIRQGTLRLLAVADHRRNRQFPQVATLDETIKGLGYEGIFGIVGPGGMHPDTVRRQHDDIVRVLADPEIRQQLDRQSMDVMGTSPHEFAAAIRDEIEHWKVAVKESGAKVS
jgi:tripartite-type tricarboxylate transporter receptor subunit TctC